MTIYLCVCCTGMHTVCVSIMHAVCTQMTQTSKVDKSIRMIQSDTPFTDADSFYIVSVWSLDLCSLQLRIEHSRGLRFCPIGVAKFKLDPHNRTGMQRLIHSSRQTLLFESSRIASVT